MRLRSITRKVLVFFIAFISMTNGFAQKPTLTVLNADAQGITLTAKQLGNLIRLEVEKLDSFEVMDRYDVAYLIEKHNLQIENCYGKICLVETGETINSQKMLSGSAELYGETLIMTLRLIDVESKVIERTHVREYLNLQKEIQSMVRVSIYELFDKEVDKVLLQHLTQKHDYESSINNPNQNKVNLSGPRMGVTVFSGKIADYMTDPEEKGGYDVLPALFQFGYQFEVQYLNEGNFQALFEFFPLVTGLDQGLVIPSLTILNGLRENRLGIEFAFGPTFSVTKKADGYFVDTDGTSEWYMRNEWTGLDPNPYPIVDRIDSRGEYAMTTGFIFAIGKTFRSGKLNIPVNAYIIPHKDGIRYGISFGYNAKK